MPTQDVKKSRRRTIGRIILGIVLLGLIAVGLQQCLCAGDLSGLPPVPPPPPAPSPNAYDYYVKGVGILISSVYDGKASKLLDFPSHRSEYTRAEKEQVMKHAAPGMSVLRQGFAYPYQGPVSRTFVSSNDPALRKFRTVELYLRFEKDTKAEYGDWGGAFDSMLDGIRFGRDVEQHGDLFGVSFGVVLEQYVKNDYPKIIDHLSATQSRSAATRMEGVIAGEFPFADAMQEEKWSSEAGLIKLLTDKDWREFLVDMGGGFEIPLSNYNRIPVVLVGRRSVLVGYLKFADALIEDAKRPYALRRMIQPSRNPLVAFQRNRFEVGRCRYEANRCDNSMIMTALALHAYRLEHSHYPATLAALVPGYLKAVPDDPFAVKSSLLYHIAGSGYVLYSIGPDGVDNGGKPIRHQGSLVHHLHQVASEHDTGDIVAGMYGY